MSFYAVVIDDDFTYAPMVRLIKTGPSPASLLATKCFEPYGTYSKCDKLAFAITQRECLVLTSTINNQPVPAHVCQFDAR